MTNKTISTFKRVYMCFLRAFKIHVKLEEMFYEAITEDKINANMFTNEKVINCNKELNFETIKLYNYLK